MRVSGLQNEVRRLRKALGRRRVTLCESSARNDNIADMRPAEQGFTLLYVLTPLLSLHVCVVLNYVKINSMD